MSGDQTARMFWRIWTTSKDGHSQDQNEDACRAAIVESRHGGDGFLLAIADGATEAIYSRLWARALVDAAESDWTALSDDELNERLERVRREFSPLEPGKELPWYVRNKFAAQGSQATLLVLTADPSSDAGWLDLRATAVGDCCLLLFSNDGGVCGFPVSRSEDFGVNPLLVRSLRQPSLKYERLAARVQVGDILLVCSDAVGRWAFSCLEEGRWSVLFQTLIELVQSETPPRNSGPHTEAVGRAEPSTVERLWNLLLGGRSDGSDEDTGDDQHADAEQETANADGESPFERFVASYRAPGMTPRMRNDDATLAVCLLLHGDSRQEAIEILGKHVAAGGAAASRHRSTAEG